MGDWCGFRPEQLDAVYDLLGRMAEAFVAILGPTAEIVVHDLRRLDASVVAIAGNLTDRRVGSPIPDPDFLPDRLAGVTEDQVGYPTRTLNGRGLVSSTVWLRDDRGNIVGAVCLNVDFNDLRLARDLLDRALTAGPRTPSTASGPPDGAMTTFASDIEQFVRIALDGVAARLGKARHKLTRADRVEAVRELDRAGVFFRRNAAETVASELGVSRASVFNYLRDARHAADGGGPKGGTRDR